MLLVDGLTADLQHVGDRLPAPALLAGVADLDRLEAVGQRAESSDSGESLGGIAARRGLGELGEPVASFTVSSKPDDLRIVNLS